MPTLGERIRAIRKQKKMTLDALAGTDLTKGMLSLIENNKANPSMESLNYIAKRLDVSVAELLEEVSQNELRDILEKAELLLNTSYEVLTDEWSQIIELIDPYLSKLHSGYEAARLLDIYSRCLYLEKKAGWEEFWDKAAEMYDKMNLTTRRANLGLIKVDQYFSSHQYEKALQMLLEESEKLEATGIWIDRLSKLDYKYVEATLYFALGNYNKAIEVMDEAILYSKDNKTFYRLDDLYRLAAAYSMMFHNDQQTDYYLEKLKAYSIFTEDKEADFFVSYATIHTLNFYKHEYEKAFNLLQDAEEKLVGENSIYAPYYQIERGGILFGLGKYTETIEVLERIVIPEFIHHPMDLSIFYCKDAYLAASQEALGNHKEAMILAETAVKNIAEMPESPYKKFINDIYQKLSK